MIVHRFGQHLYICTTTSRIRPRRWCDSSMALLLCLSSDRSLQPNGFSGLTSSRARAVNMKFPSLSLVKSIWSGTRRHWILKLALNHCADLHIYWNLS
ncbi:uncharacterized protein B0H18DRAFT_1029603 [Fomitopsis serialis]|uniref:uncharacterized protein n=1 Tax=Fomitopsis serialis TaxID=139415 RepID=UPI002008602D|nr:uncharacterized protein B0H18DRAFT_1029603 [Neoantrodia serialis]KAH9919057.1 hypothetical protein B0H18DRAFT_1029603 [Neoantrodia serialis]